MCVSNAFVMIIGKGGGQMSVSSVVRVLGPQKKSQVEKVWRCKDEGSPPRTHVRQPMPLPGQTPHSIVILRSKETCFGRSVLVLQPVDKEYVK